MTNTDIYNIHQNAVIRLCDLATGYRGKNGVKTVAEHLNTELYSGELTCLLGANGCGKSTLLKTLSAFLPSVSGDIFLQGRHLQDYSDKELAKIIGVVLTERCSIRNMSVEELVGMGRSPYTGFWGHLAQQDIDIINHSIELVGISNLKHRMVQTLSDGERQKVMIAKALAQETPIIFLDEPTAFLDYPSKVEIMQLLHDLSRETDKTIFLSTHDMELALQIADRIWLMKKGEGVTVGIPEDLSLNGALQGFFSRKGIEFDGSSGLYKIAAHFHSRIRLEGDPSESGFCMMRKALQRAGFATGAADAATTTATEQLATLPDSGVTIRCEGRVFRVWRTDQEDTPKGYDSIEDVLNSILPAKLH